MGNKDYQSRGGCLPGIPFGKMVETLPIPEMWMYGDVRKIYTQSYAGLVGPKATRQPRML